MNKWIWFLIITMLLIIGGIILFLIFKNPLTPQFTQPPAFPR